MTRHTVLASLAGLALLLALAIAGITAIKGGEDTSHASPARIQKPGPLTQTRPAPPLSSIGVPMIPVATGEKALSEAEVKAYVQSHDFIGGEVTTGGFPTATMLTTEMAAAYQQHNGVRLPIAANEQIIIVKLSGPFHITNANAPEQAKAALASKPALFATEVFVAATGNLIEWNL